MVHSPLRREASLCLLDFVVAEKKKWGGIYSDLPSCKIKWTRGSVVFSWDEVQQPVLYHLYSQMEYCVSPEDSQSMEETLAEKRNRKALLICLGIPLGGKIWDWARWAVVQGGIGQGTWDGDKSSCLRMKDGCWWCSCPSCLPVRTGKCKRFFRAAKVMGSSCAPAASEIKGY